MINSSKNAKQHANYLHHSTGRGHGMVVRDVRTTIPPRVESSLTVLGVKIATRLRGLADLLEASMEEVLAVRAAFDR